MIAHEWAICRGVFISAALLSMLVSCASASNQGSSPGGNCNYHTFPGSVVFTLVNTPSGTIEAHCKFTPNDPGVVSQYLIHSNDADLILRYNNTLPTTEWLTANGISTGKTFDCNRKEIRSGTCTPVLFEFPAIPGASAQ